jgi:hypothetical protein
VTGADLAQPQRRQQPVPNNNNNYFWIHKNNSLSFLLDSLEEILAANPSLRLLRESLHDLVSRSPVWKASFEQSHPDDKIYRDAVTAHYRQVPFENIRGPSLQVLESLSPFLVSEEQRRSFGIDNYRMVHIEQMLFAVYLMQQRQEEQQAKANQPGEDLAAAAASMMGQQQAKSKKEDKPKTNFGMRLTQNKWEVKSYDGSETFRPAPTLENVIRAMQGFLFLSHKRPYAFDLVLVPLNSFFHRKVWDKLKRSATGSPLWLMKKDEACTAIGMNEVLSSLLEMAEFAGTLGKETNEEVY